VVPFVDIVLALEGMAGGLVVMLPDPKLEPVL
jgi:hypothetical protein